MAVTDVQPDSQFFLRHAVGLAQMLDTFACGVRIKVHKPALRTQSAGVRASDATRAWVQRLCSQRGLALQFWKS